MSKKAVQDRSRELDQFYTNPVYAQSFYDIIKTTLDLESADILLEPSAGSGSFYNIMDSKKRVGLDLEPKSAGIIQQDFFTWTPDPASKVITIGNPPFGKNSSLAVKFFNHAATFSDAIAFIIPRTFRKTSIINRLSRDFHLVYDSTSPENSFIFNNKPYDVWCCAQIWVRKTTNRPVISTYSLSDVAQWFEIVEPDQADFAIQRVGGRAGQIRTSDFKQYSKLSNYFIKQHHADTLDIFKSVDFDGVKFNTALNPSISPSELVELWKEAAVNWGINVPPAKVKNTKKIIQLAPIFQEDNS
jgi:hypothetical protein